MRAHLTPFRLVAGALVLATAAALAAGPRFAGGHPAAALDALGDASRAWLVIALLGFVAAYLTAACAWRTALAARGARLPLAGVVARLGLGSVVNTFVPARAGDAVKIALFSESLDGRDRIWTASGLYAAVAASRSFSIAALVLAGSAAGALPLWPALLLAGGAAAVVVAGARSARLRRRHRIAHLLDGVAALARSPRAAAALVAWSTGTTLARLLGTTALAAAISLPHPVLAGLLIAAALDAAGTLPLTPGNLGVASGAVAVALATRGIGAGQAMGVGIGVQVLETFVSLAAGGFGLLHFAHSRLQLPPWTARVAGVGATVAVAVGGALASGLVSA